MSKLSSISVKRRSRRVGLILAAGLAATLAGVAAGHAQTKTKIGLIYESRAADQPWSASIIDAANKLAKSDSSIQLIQSYNAFDPTAAEPVARQMIAQGAAVIDFHSFALNDVAHALAKTNPKVVMSVSSFDPPLQPNLNVGTASYFHIGYSDCWLLAKVSKSHKIGIVGPMPIPYATELLTACQLGAEAASPGTKVLSGYANSFTNQQATREQAQVLLDQGADALFPSSATQDSLGGYQLCEQKKIACAGWASDIRRYAPKYGVVSAVIDWSVLLKALVAKSKAPSMQAETFDAVFGNGLVPQPMTAADAAIVPVNVQHDYLAVVNDLKAGKINLPKSTAHPCCQ